MSEVNTYEVNPDVDISSKERSTREQSFQERREAVIEDKVENISAQIAFNMQANLDPDMAKSTEQSLEKGPLSLDVLGQYFGNIEVNSQQKASIDIHPYGEFDYHDIDIQKLNEDFTAKRLVSMLLWSSAMLKLPVETYRSSMDLQNFNITPKAKEEILRYMLKRDNKEVSDVINVISNQPPENITDEDIEYLVEARKNRGGITSQEVDQEAQKVRGQIESLLLEDKWENLPPEVLSHVLSVGAQIEKVELGNLVSEVYPAFERYREDIKEALNLAFLDQEEFVKKYVENEDVVNDIKEFISNLNRRVPAVAKGAFSIGLIVLASKLVACSSIASGAVEETVPKEGEIPTVQLETGEGHMSGGATETMGEQKEYTFNSIVDDSDFQAQGQNEQEEVVEESRFHIPEIDEKFVDSIDITRWKDYEIEVIRDIQPENYIPTITSYVYEQNDEKKLFNTPLFILPTDRSTGEVDTNLPILQYNLTPALFRSFKVGRIYELKTPEGIKITFGAPQSSSTSEFNGEFLVLMEVSDLQGKEIKFMQLEESQKETDSLQRSLWPSHGYLELDFSYWENGVQLFDNVKTTEFEELLQAYDPESLDWYEDLIYFEGSEKVSYPSRPVPLGEKYSADEVENFIEIFSTAYSPSSEVFFEEGQNSNDIPKYIQEALEIGESITEELVDIIDITQWQDYELESVEIVEPVTYFPKTVSYVYYDTTNKTTGVLSPPLYVFPMEKNTNKVDRYLPILEYSINPDLFSSFEVSKIFRITSPEGDEIILGGPKDSSEKKLNAEFLILVEVNTRDGDTIRFMQEEGGEYLSDTRESIPLSFDKWWDNLSYEGREINDYLELLKLLDPEERNIGQKYESYYIRDFINILEDDL